MFKTLKRTKVSLALSAALAMGTFSGQAQAVNLTEDNLGDAGIFQYYSARENWQTFFRIINTSDDAVAVKLRFHEAANSREVLDFTVFLSPRDEWLAWTDDSADTLGNPGIRTNDTSCIYESTNGNTLAYGFKDQGAFKSAIFDDAAFTGDYSDGNTNISDRLREGYLTVIGVVQVDPSGSMTSQEESFVEGLTHNNREPENCTQASLAYTNLENEIGTTPGNFLSASTEVGNILGMNGYLVNLESGQGGGYNPAVLANFSTTDPFNGGLFTQAMGSVTKPDLDSGDAYSFVMNNVSGLAQASNWAPASNINGVTGDPTETLGYTLASTADISDLLDDNTLNASAAVPTINDPLLGTVTIIPFDVNGDGVCGGGETLDFSNAPVSVYDAITAGAQISVFADASGKQCFTTATLVAPLGVTTDVAATVTPISARVANNGQASDALVTGGVDAVSAAFMRDTVSNEWAAYSSDGVFKDYFTQWVVTFPTKNYYVDLADDADFEDLIQDDISATLKDVTVGNDAFAPFSEEFDIAGESCESYQMKLWDTEETAADYTSPRDAYAGELCNEVNVINFDAAYSAKGLASQFSEVVPSEVFPTDPTTGNKAVLGWAELSFVGSGSSVIGLTSGESGWAALNVGNDLEAGLEDAYNYKGLPVDGFMLSVYDTGDARNHTMINEHKYTRNITPVTN